MLHFFMLAARIVAWLLALIIIVLSLVPPWLRPETDLPHALEHFGIYFLTGVSYSTGYRWRLPILAAASVTFAGAIELAQLAVPGRHARLSDFIVDAFALCFGVAVASFVVRRRSNSMLSSER